jgi:hypothetical protein
MDKYRIKNNIFLLILNLVLDTDDADAVAEFPKLHASKWLR